MGSGTGNEKADESVESESSLDENMECNEVLTPLISFHQVELIWVPGEEMKNPIYL